ncbi:MULTISPECIES: cupin domain-containing protein [Pantoea]|jgi:mannose-6-phosphate isomerase-like protein (cupin superfamily)|uniref:Cupin domain-containing protein n=1 Tax=Pantoea piersonii TaxID=2364647 RepID=A0AAJ5QN27_9GAMM|nr:MULTISPECIES: cupin domain-containing protein [Pantoea]MBZ6384399.1 cupin domain-containing protein [Pantoea piersonii]MBZ6402350.1 cupin domain-containing protein [Pantoea piersonii]MBZ6406340.1 cupin domain-containing protein [Pantoea piersonii]MBZ6425086.1 cupin domain-containing protein [Pantoea piersonii]NYB02745.1 cupin domain-containing protein [Pantoea piersonii]
MAELSSQKSARFRPAEIAAQLPATATTLLADIYLTDRPEASSRVFRAYRGVPPHYHRECDEYLYVLSGRGTFWMEDAATEAEFGPGDMLFFERNVVHALPVLLEEPVIFLTLDTPRRSPDDVVFIDSSSDSAATFMARSAAHHR